MSQVRMEPMETGQMMDRILRLFFGNFLTVVGIAFLLALPCTIFEVGWAATHLAPKEDPGSALFQKTIVLLFNCTFGIWTTSSIVFYIGQICQGNPGSMQAALRQGLSRFGAVFSARFRAGLWIVLGCILLVIPGIYWAFLYMLVTPVVMLDDPECDALERSESLVKDRIGAIFLLSLGIGLVAFIFVFLLGMAEGAGLGAAYASVYGQLDARGMKIIEAIGSLIGSLFAPIYAIMTVVLYYDCRVREEGLDLETMDRALSEA